jgi:hypothetical protein
MATPPPCPPPFRGKANHFPTFHVAAMFCPVLSNLVPFHGMIV